MKANGEVHIAITLTREEWQSVICGTVGSLSHDITARYDPITITFEDLARMQVVKVSGKHMNREGVTHYRPGTLPRDRVYTGKKVLLRGRSGGK